MKSEADRHLIDLATSVADGARVDWNRAAASTATDEDRELIDGLRLLERIAAVHSEPIARTHDQVEASEPPAEWNGLQVLETIGRGTTGYVCRAWDPRLERHVALKFLESSPKSSRAADTLSDREIVSEGRLMARVKHPHVVTVFGADSLDGRVGIWMELVEGRTLEAELRARGPLPASEIEQIGLHVADALAAVHGAGLIHRDVKAQNVMREPNHRTVLMDFGTGVDLEAHADVADVAGTPLYLAPEVIDGGSATFRSDVYALGVLMFHLATGDFPVRGRTLREVRRTHARGERQTIASVRTGLPRSLGQIIDRALSTSPADRFADATAMATALRAVGSGAARRRLVAVASVVLLTILGAGFAAYRLSGDRSPRAAGLTWTELPADFLKVANLRGPAVDGEWAPCTSPRGTRNVALCNVVNHQVRVLRTSPNAKTVGQPQGRALLSPDGSRVAYVWEGEPDSRIHALNVINVDGTNPRVLFSSESDISLDEWTSDGRALLIRAAMGTKDHRAILAAADGGPPREILRLAPTDRRTTLSPDGRVLVIEREAQRSNADLVAIDLATSSEAWRFGHPTNDTYPLWQPDGRGVVFVSDPAGCRQILHLPIDSGVPGNVSKLHDLGPQSVELAGFGADGSLFVRSVDRDRTVLLAPLYLERGTVGASRSLQSDCAGVTMGAHWSPDGDRIALIRGASWPDVGLDLVIARIDGVTEATYPIPGGWSPHTEARWSPNGRSVAVNHANAAAAEVLSERPIDQKADVRELARSIEGTVLRRPRWDPTGRFLLYQNIAIRKVELATGTNEEADLPADAGSGGRVAFQTNAGFDIARDGARVFGVTAPDDRRDCRLRIVEPGGRVIDRHVFQGHGCYGIAWNSDASRILVGTIAREEWPPASLWLLSRAAGDPVRMLKDLRPFWDLSVSPDDKQLLITVGAAPQSWAILSGIPAAPPPSVPNRVQPMTPVAQPDVALSGTVTGADGKPLEGLYVYSYRRLVKNGVPTLTTVPPAVPTDRDGRYRLAGRPPGEYVVVVSAHISLTGGRSELRAPPPIIGSNGARLGYAATFYRARGSASPAPTIVKVENGEVGGLDIQLQRRPVFNVSGTVTGLPAGQAAPIAIVASSVVPGPEWPGSARRAALIDGKFVFADLPDGTYRISLTVGTLIGEAEFVVAGRSPNPVRVVLRER